MNHQISHPMGVILVESIALAPGAHRRDVHLGDLGANAPGHLERRAGLVVRRAGCGASVLNGNPRIGWNIQRLVNAVLHFMPGQLAKILGRFVIDQNVHLRFHAQLRILDRVIQARPQSRARLDLRA